MRKNLLILITLVGFSISAIATAKPCETCQVLDKAGQGNFRLQKTVQKSRDLLMNFEFSKDEKIKSLEIQSYLKLSLKAVQADEIGMADEYLYNTYVLDKAAFDNEIKKLKAIDKAIITKSLKNTIEARQADDIK